MTGPDHFAKAEELLHVAGHPSISSEAEASALASAQVHATLALAAATVESSTTYTAASGLNTTTHIGGSDWEAVITTKEGTP